MFLESILLVLIVIVFILHRLIKSGEFLPWYTRLFGLNAPEYPISGQVAKGYEEVKTVFEEHFLQGREVGASIVVFSGEDCVVELFGGYENFEKKVPYSSTTLQLVYSCSKVLESIGLARLVDQGLISYNDKISTIWPEFSKGGKENVTISDLMRHEGGLTYFFDPQPTLEELSDPERLQNVLANHPHIWEGKKVRSYHAISRGWITNEVVKRLDKKNRTLGQIYEEDFNKGLNIEFYLGLKKEHLTRRSTWYSYPKLDSLITFFLPISIIGNKAAVGSSFEAFRKGKPLTNIFKLRKGLVGFENGSDIISGESPSSNGFTNANSLGTVAACLANKGKFNGFELISEKGLDQALGEATTEFDTCLCKVTTLAQSGLGVFEVPELGISTKFYGWPGLGGSLVLFNPEYKFGFAYVMNGAHLSSGIGGRAKATLIAAFRSHIKCYK